MKVFAIKTGKDIINGREIGLRKENLKYFVKYQTFLIVIKIKKIIFRTHRVSI